MGRRLRVELADGYLRAGHATASMACRRDADERRRGRPLAPASPGGDERQRNNRETAEQPRHGSRRIAPRPQSIKFPGRRGLIGGAWSDIVGRGRRVR